MQITCPLPRVTPTPVPAWYRAVFGGLALDPDAAAYIAAVEAGGVTDAHLAGLGMPAWSVIRPAIDARIREWKTSGIWDLIKRLYLPIWGLAAPNEICMRSLTSGSFVNAPTMGAGFVQGNGTSQYFDFGVSPATLGMTNNSAFLSALLLSPAPATGTNRSVIGVRQSTTQDCRILMPGGGGMSGIIMDAGATIVSTADRLGILIAARKSGTRFNGQRKASGWTILNTLTDANAGTAPTLNLFGMAFNFDGSPAGYIESRIGSMSVGLGLSAGDADAFTANLKTLWETATGLSLPA